MSALTTPTAASQPHLNLSNECRDAAPVAFLGFGLTRRSAADRARRIQQLSERHPDYMDNPVFADEEACQELAEAFEQIETPDTSWVSHLLTGPSGSSLSRISKEIAVFTKEQERVSFLWFNYCRFRTSEALDDVEGEHDLRGQSKVLAWDDKALEARERIAQYNLGLAVAMLKRLPPSVDRTEMLSEGFLALLRAIDKFDIDRGFKFSTYACNAIVKAYSRRGMKLTRQHQLAPYSFEPSMEKTDWTDTCNGDQKDFCLEVLRKVLHENTAKLEPIEYRILQERYHLDGAEGDKPLTLREVGAMVNLTKERVRQIQIKALARIRKELEPEI